MTGFRTARSTWGVLAAAATLAMGCAGELEGNPQDYVKAWGNPAGQGGSTAGGSVGVAGAAAGTPAGGSNTAGSSFGGAPAGGMGGGMIPMDPPCVAMVFESLCTTCHKAGVSVLLSADLDLQGANLGARLSKTAALYKGVTNSESCKTGALIIDPVNPSESILLKKVTNAQVCGGSMPLGGTLTGDNLLCIQNWITSFGASANMVSFGDNGGGSGGGNL